MIFTFVSIWIFVFVLGGTALGGLLWAIQTGQFKNLSESAKSIFDEEEPLGKMTDRFPAGNQGSKLR